MNRKVAIVGFAQSRHQYDMPKTREDMVFEVTRDALKHAGISRQDVGSVVSASTDFLDGRTISSMFLCMAVGAHLKDESKVEQDGMHAMLFELTNKFDLAQNNLDVVENVKTILCNHQHPIYPTSAKSGHNVEMVFQTLAESILNNGQMVIKPGIQDLKTSENIEDPSSLLDYIMIRFCEAMDDQEFAMHIVRKQIADEGIDFQDLELNEARNLIDRLAELYEGFKGIDEARKLKMDLMKAYRRFNEDVDPFA